MFLFVSVNELTLAVEPFHPTTTAFRLPSVWAAVKVTVTVACGVAELLYTKEMVAP